MTAILVFARAPEPGRAKTRLIPALGPDGAAALHRALLRHALASAADVAAARLELWGTGDDPREELADLAAEFGAELRWQVEGDLGRRMQAALTGAVARDGSALVIGSDCPWLDAVAIRRARAELDTHDAVLGPAHDGGYVLFGMKHVAATLFDDMPWGTACVLERTRERLAALGWRWFELESRSDVDRPEDLPGLRALGSKWAGLVDQA